MLRKLAVGALLLVGVVLTGCTYPSGAVIAPIMNTKSAVAVGDTSVGMSKVGEATCEGILFLSKGDASIKAAMEEAGITRIHHVDSEEQNILGIYSTKTIRVYGE